MVAALVPSIVVAAANEVASTLIEVAAFAVKLEKGAVPRSIEPALAKVKTPAAAVPEITASTVVFEKSTLVALTLLEIVTVPTEVN